MVTARWSRIRGISVVNYRNIEKLDLDFESEGKRDPTDLCVVVMGVRSGREALFDAMNFCLYGKGEAPRNGSVSVLLEDKAGKLSRAFRDSSEKSTKESRLVPPAEISGLFLLDRDFQERLLGIGTRKASRAEATILAGSVLSDFHSKSCFDFPLVMDCPLEEFSEDVGLVVVRSLFSIARKKQIILITAEPGKQVMRELEKMAARIYEVGKK